MSDEPPNEIHKAGGATIHPSGAGEQSVARGLNELRIAVFALVVSFSATLGVEWSRCWWSDLVWTGVVAGAALALLWVVKKPLAWPMYYVPASSRVR